MMLYYVIILSRVKANAKNQKATQKKNQKGEKPIFSESFQMLHAAAAFQHRRTHQRLRENLPEHH